MAVAEGDFYRSLRKEEYPDGTIIDSHAVRGVLYPSFEEKTFVRTIKGRSVTSTRPADTVPYKKDGVDVVDSGHGTSLFDREYVFGSKDWWSFKIPAGTPIPDSIKIVLTGYNERFGANHHQIEPAALIMPVDAFKGALDNLARNAVKKLCEDGRSS